MLALVIDQYSVNTNLDWSYHLLSQSVLWPSCQLLLLGPFYKSLSRSLSLSSTLSDYHKLSVSLLCQLDVRSIWQIKSCRCSKLTWSVELRIMYDPGISIPKINDVQSSGFVFSDARSWFCRVCRLVLPVNHLAVVTPYRVLCFLYQWIRGWLNTSGTRHLRGHIRASHIKREGERHITETWWR